MCGCHLFCLSPLDRGPIDIPRGVLYGGFGHRPALEVLKEEHKSPRQNPGNFPAWSEARLGLIPPIQYLASRAQTLIPTTHNSEASQTTTPKATRQISSGLVPLMQSSDLQGFWKQQLGPSGCSRIKVLELTLEQSCFSVSVSLSQREILCV